MNGKGKNIFELFKAKETTGVDFNLNWIFFLVDCLLRNVSLDTTIIFSNILITRLIEFGA